MWTSQKYRAPEQAGPNTIHNAEEIMRQSSNHTFIAISMNYALRIAIVCSFGILMPVLSATDFNDQVTSTVTGTNTLTVHANSASALAAIQFKTNGANTYKISSNGGTFEITDSLNGVQQLSMAPAAIGSGYVAVNNTTPASTPTSGALRVAGGMGVVGALHVGGAANVGGTLSSGQFTSTLATHNSLTINANAASAYAILQFKTNGTNTYEIYSNGTSLEFQDQANVVTQGKFIPGATNAGYFRLYNTTPSTTSANGALVVDGGVGIGGAVNIATGSAKFSMKENAPNAEFKIASSSNVYSDVVFNTVSTDQCRIRGSSYGLAVGGANPRLNIGYPDANYSAALAVNGNVGIGTTNPQSALSVNGTITTKEVKVTLTGWSDHVFSDGYRLRDLSEVEASIKADRHLPGIPSEQELVGNGLPVADMMAKHMEKIEELTLYAIQANKEIEAVRSENDDLRKRLEALEAKLSSK